MAQYRPPLDLSWPGFRNLDGLRLDEYGPITFQTARETHMINRVQEIMAGVQSGMLIAGSAHHQSLAEKLITLGYLVEAFAWAGPGDALPDCMSSDWKWVTPDF
jgi:hypothetical protein